MRLPAVIARRQMFASPLARLRGEAARTDSHVEAGQWRLCFLKKFGYPGYGFIC